MAHPFAFIMKNIFPFLLALFLFVGCRSKDALVNKTDFSEFSEIIKLQGSKWGMDTLLNKPARTFLLDSNLIVVDLKDDSSLYVINVNSKSLVAKTGLRGKDVGRILSPWTFTDAPNDKRSFWVFDLTLDKFVLYNIDSILNSSDYVPKTEVILSKALHGVYFPHWINKDTFMSPTLFGDKRLLYGDKAGNLLDKKVAFVSTDTSKVPNDLNQQAFNTLSLVNRNKNKFVLLCRSADRLELYDFHGNLIKKQVGPNGYTPNFTVRKMYGLKVLAHNSDEHFTYVECASDDNYIYALYSGYTDKEKGKLASDGNRILVFDWEGTPVKEYELDQLVTCIQVDPVQKKIFALAYKNKIPDILEFPLK